MLSSFARRYGWRKQIILARFSSNDSKRPERRAACEPFNCACLQTHRLGTGRDGKAGGRKACALCWANRRFFKRHSFKSTCCPKACSENRTPSASPVRLSTPRCGKSWAFSPWGFAKPRADDDPYIAGEQHCLCGLRFTTPITHLRQATNAPFMDQLDDARGRIPTGDLAPDNAARRGRCEGQERSPPDGS